MKHTRTWILTANASKALCYERIDDQPKLTLVTETEDPLGCARNADLGDDRAGYESMGVGRGSAAYSPRTDPKTKRCMRALRASWRRCSTMASPAIAAMRSRSLRRTRSLGTAVPTDLTRFDRGEILTRVDNALHRPG